MMFAGKSALRRARAHCRARTGERLGDDVSSFKTNWSVSLHPDYGARSKQDTLPPRDNSRRVSRPRHFAWSWTHNDDRGLDLHEVDTTDNRLQRSIMNDLLDKVDTRD